MTRSPAPWSPVLRSVQVRVQRRQAQRVLRQLTALAALTLLGLGLLRWGLGLSITWRHFALLSGVLLLASVLLWSRLRPFQELDAARLTDRQASLDGVLTTALTLPATHTDELEGALQQRVRLQAGQAAQKLQPAQVVPADPARVWVWPALLLCAGLGVWWLPPRPLPSPAPVAAVVPEEDNVKVDRTTSQPADLTSAAPSPTEPSGQTAPDTSGLNDIPRGQEPEAPAVPASNAGSTPALSGVDVTVTGAGAFTPQRVKEAREAILPSDTRHVQAALAKAGGTSVDTPFGSREGGRISKVEAPSNGDALAAAPYDPTTAKGKSQKQQAPEGSTGLRSASGGRGVESNGDERCVDRCMTNNDMNRGGDPLSDAGKKAGSSVSAGTSNSGSQAAGSSSGTGLGVGRLKDLQTTYQQELLGQSNVNADRVQVLVAPTTTPPGQSSPAGGVSGAAWQSAPETPGLNGSVPLGAQDTVSAYFARTTDRRNP
ncbi:hypothetical protein ACFOPQ_08945 [Deinococcus antarcticus]|uniref:Uncharacterized protein n=2 Tax=Deinococcus TaxID=1298 RepID=A0ABP9V8Z6_9DEIO